MVKIKLNKKIGILLFSMLFVALISGCSANKTKEVAEFKDLVQL